MFKKSFVYIFLFFLYANTVHAKNISSCTIDIGPQNIILSDDQKLLAKDLSSLSNCKEPTLNKIAEFFINNSQLPNNNYFQSLINSDFSLETPAFTLEHVNLVFLPKKLLSLLNLSEDFIFTDLKSFNQKTIIPISENSILFATCKTCNRLGPQHIELTIKKQTQTEKIWIQGSLKTYAQGLVALETIPLNNNPINPLTFAAKKIITANPEHLFSDIEALKFFKVNKQIIVGQELNQNDLIPINLVHFNSPTQALLENDSIKMNITVFPTKNGRYGESIEVRGPYNNKKMRAKVVDLNKVIIQI